MSLGNIRIEMTSRKKDQHLCRFSCKSSQSMLDIDKVLPGLESVKNFLDRLVLRQLAIALATALKLGTKCGCPLSQRRSGLHPERDAPGFNPGDLTTPRSDATALVSRYWGKQPDAYIRLISFICCE
jgi:hypothetical protein